MRFKQGKGGGGGGSGNTYVSAIYMTADATIAVNNIAAGLDAAATAAWASGACDTPVGGGGGEGYQGAALRRTGQMHKMDTANAV